MTHKTIQEYIAIIEAAATPAFNQPQPGTKYVPYDPKKAATPAAATPAAAPAQDIQHNAAAMANQQAAPAAPAAPAAQGAHAAPAARVAAKPDPEVLKIQQELIKRGYPLKADGIMGPKTKAAQEYEMKASDMQSRGAAIQADANAAARQQTAAPAGVNPSMAATYDAKMAQPAAPTSAWDQAAAQAEPTDHPRGGIIRYNEDISLSGSMKKYMNIVENTFFGQQLPDADSMDITGQSRATQRKPTGQGGTKIMPFNTKSAHPAKPFSAADIPTEPPTTAQGAHAARAATKPDPAVVKLQKELIAKGYPLTADGIMGPDTKRAMDYENEFGSSYASTQNAELQKLQQPMSEHVSFGNDETLTRIVDLINYSNK